MHLDSTEPVAYLVVLTEAVPSLYGLFLFVECVSQRIAPLSEPELMDLECPCRRAVLLDISCFDGASIVPARIRSWLQFLFRVGVSATWTMHIRSLVTSVIVIEGSKIKMRGTLQLPTVAEKCEK